MNGSDLVDRYLADMASAATTLRPARRAELLDEVREHIAVALEGADPGDTAAVLNVLERLGSPAEIVAAEWTAEGGTPTAPAAQNRPPEPMLPPASPLPAAPVPASGPQAPPAPQVTPPIRAPRRVSLGIVGLVGAAACIGIGFVVGDLYTAAIVAVWLAPVLVLLLLVEVVRSGAAAPAARTVRSASPVGVGLVAVGLVLGAIVLSGDYYAAAMTALLFVPVLILLLLLSVVRGRRVGG
jgi:hypothetical protein